MDGLREAVAELGVGGLDPARLEIEPLLNRGGFTNRSFRVSSGPARIHVKLRALEDGLDGLQRWRGLHERLERDYRAPRMLGWIEVGEGFAGPVFEWLDGTVPERLSGALLDEVAGLLRRLHGDAALAAALTASSAPDRTCADVYLGNYDRRFREDLVTIAAAPPPFLDDSVLGAMRSEAERLAERVRGSAAFDAPARSPTHGDLWTDNVLAGAATWHLLDWDELSLGDPVQDWCMLLGPSRADPQPVTARDWPRLMRPGGAASERTALYARATLLDWIIDPLADWVEAEKHPAQRDAIRETNATVHRAALASFERHFGALGG